MFAPSRYERAAIALSEYISSSAQVPPLTSTPTLSLCTEQVLHMYEQTHDVSSLAWVETLPKEEFALTPVHSFVGLYYRGLYYLCLNYLVIKTLLSRN